MKFLMLFFLLFFTNCSVEHEKTKPTQKIERCPGAPKVILDNDHYDPDWLITLITAIGMDRECKINLIGVMINGKDLHEKSGLMYNTVLTYYGIQNRVPIGINHFFPMRTTLTKATGPNPKIDKEYKGTKRNITEFESDGLLDFQRPDVTDILCNILEKEENNSIIYVTGGHLQNLQALLMTDKCDGKNLIISKFQKIIFGTGYSKEKEGFPEMNFSEGAFDSTPASEAANFVFKSGIDKHIPFIFPNDTLLKGIGEKYRPGDQYKEDVHIDSPMAFVYAVPQYGVWGDNGFGDSEAVLSASELDSVIATPYREVCIKLNSKNAIIKVDEKKKCNHFIKSYLPGAEGYINDILNYYINLPVENQDGKG